MKNTFGQLSTVLIGNLFDIEKIKSKINMPALQYKLLDIIVKETIEDVQSYKEILESCNVKVFQLEIDQSLVDTFYNTTQKSITPYIEVKDRLFCVGDNIFISNLLDDTRLPELNGLRNVINYGLQQKKKIIQCPTMLEDSSVASLPDEQWPGNFQPIFDSSSLILFEDKIFYTLNECTNQKGIEWLKLFLPDIQFISLASHLKNHLDDQFRIYRPGLCASTISKEDLCSIDPMFRSWDVIDVRESKENLAKVREKRLSNIKQFHEFVWLKDWINLDIERGSIEINSISVNENLVIVPTKNAWITRHLERRNIEVVEFDFRHKQFWGSGLSCLTADIERN